MNDELMQLGWPVIVAMSTKHDGHMSFGKVDNKQTYSNIRRFINGDIRFNTRQHTAFMRISYQEGNTYDMITSITQKNAGGPQITHHSMIHSDAFITSIPNTLLMVPVADCYPFILFDPTHKVLSLVHVGWQSSHARLLINVVEYMTKLHETNPLDLLVYVGPGIAAEHYIFSETTQKDDPDWSNYLTRLSTGYAIDLLGFNMHLLTQSIGIPISRITVSPRNTVDDPNLESHYQHTARIAACSSLLTCGYADFLSLNTAIIGTPFITR